MKMVKVADAKNNLSRHLAYVRRGGRIRILDRDTPIADLIPVESPESGDEEDRLLATLERKGVLRRGDRGPLPEELFEPGPADPSGSVLASLLEERRKSR
jgi:antitoxin (DNA-binding transcriptional repressor) of toxin-antitoxin stability system